MRDPHHPDASPPEGPAGARQERREGLAPRPGAKGGGARPGETAQGPVLPEAALEPRPAAGTVLWRLGLALAIVAADVATKAWVFAWMGSDPEGLVRDAHGHLRYPILGDWLAWMLSRNPGAAFGGFASMPRLLVGGRVVAVLFLIWLLARTAPGRRVFAAALVLVLGGALGNLWDNLFEPRPPGRPFGAVRDFIDVYFRFDWTVPLVGWRWEVDWHFPTFNVADSCITIGAVLLLLSGLFREGEVRSEPDGSGAEGPSRRPPPAPPAGRG